MTDGICIYCKNFGPLTSEHVLPKALGGNTTTPLVCDRCRFPQLDQALAQHSLVTLDRAGYTPKGAFPAPIGGEVFHFDAELGLHLEATIKNGMTAAPLPQLHFETRAEDFLISIVMPDLAGRDALIGFIDARVEGGTLANMHIKVGPDHRCPTVRIAMHRSRDGYIRARTQEEARLVLDHVSKKWKEGLREVLLADAPVSSVTEKPHVVIRMSACVDDEYRAVAKIAFNAMAMDFGPEFARRKEFDPIREYISGKDIRHPKKLAPNEIAIDHRFVAKDYAGSKPIMPSTGHVVLIDNFGPKLIACVSLYGGHHYRVELGEVESPKLGPWCREFSIDRTGSHVLDPFEMLRRQQTRNQDGS